MRADTARARTGERIGTARTALLAAVEGDLSRARPALRSRLGDLLAAVLDTVFVVVAMDRSAGPTSFAVRIPARRLRPHRAGRWRLMPRARLRIDLLTASANTDRLIRLTLPEGVAYLPPADPARHPPLARIEVQEPRPMGELRAIADAVLADRDRPPTWTDRRLAGMGADQVDACLAVLAQYRVTPPVDGDRNGEAATLAVADRLHDLQDHFRRVVAATPGLGRDAKRDLHRSWASGSWLPQRLERRLSVNTATPGVVHLRTTAAQGSVTRANPTRAVLDVDVAVTESSVLDTARDTSLITLGLLALVAVLTLLNPPGGGRGGVDAQTLATVLVLFPAIQAGRIERPDRGSLRGLLTQPTYLLSLATVFPPVGLATALAFGQGGTDPRLLAGAALAAQGLLHLVLRRRPPRRLGVNAPVAPVTLSTDRRPALARLDRLRGRSIRTLVAEALLLGREAHAYIARDDERPGVLEQLLHDLDGDGGPAAARRGDGGGLLGLMRSGIGGRALTFVVHSQQVRRGGSGPRAGRPGVGTGPHLVPVPFIPARLAPLESPAWIVEILVGLPRGVIRGLPLPLHPVTLLGGACRDSGFPILLVQHPSPPPVHGRPGLDWLRVRVSVPFVPGEDLSGLRRFLDVVDGLRADRPGRGRCAVHVYLVPELAAYEAPETAADEVGARRQGLPAGLQPGTRPAREEDVVGDDPGPVLPVALCAGARVGLVGDVLDVIARSRPDVRLAGVTIALLHGLAVSFLYCAAARPPQGDGTDPADPDVDVAATLPADPDPDQADDPGTAHPAEGLGAVVRSALEGSDEVYVAVEAVADGTEVRPTGAGRGRSGRPERPGPLLRMQLRTPDRAGVVPSTLQRLSAVVRQGAGGAPLPGLDVWFALLRVVDGRSLQGRVGVWLPPGDWFAVDWSPLTEDEQAYLPAGREGGPPLVEDDPVLTVNLARVAVAGGAPDGAGGGSADAPGPGDSGGRGPSGGSWVAPGGGR